jgi:hypothetical protein
MDRSGVTGCVLEQKRRDRARTVTRMLLVRERGSLQVPGPAVGIGFA